VNEVAFMIGTAVTTRPSLAGRLTARRHSVLVGVLVMVVMTVVGAALGGSPLGSGGFVDPSSESERARELLGERFDREESGIVLVVSTATGTVDDPDVADSGRRLTERFAVEPGVTGVVSYWATGIAGLRSDDERHALVLARVEGDDADETRVAETRAAELADEYRTGTGAAEGAIAVGVTGS
jgi:putative drug exporter of the RND superfamily